MEEIVNVQDQELSPSSLICIGVNHHHAPVEVREQIAFSENNISEALRHIVSYHDVREAAILSTCNRVEIYAHGLPDITEYTLESFLLQYHKVSPHILQPHLYRFSGSEALRQLFRVTSSLDSLVMGEPQITGQVKDAYAVAAQNQTLGPLLHRAFSHAFLTAKRIRNETGVGKSAVSISFATMELAKKVFGSLQGLNCLLIGAGEMSELAAKLYRDKGANIIVVNRSLSHATQLASKYEGQAATLEDLNTLLPKADIVLASTAAPRLILLKEHVANAMKLRRFKSMLLIDIAVPRNIDPQASDIGGVYAYDIDDLGNVVRDNLLQREQEAQFGEKIVQEEINQFNNRLNEQRAVPLIKVLKEHGHNIANRELERTLALLGSDITPLQRKQIQAMAISITNKLLHRPLTELREYAKLPDNESERLFGTAKNLFGISE